MAKISNKLRALKDGKTLWVLELGITRQGDKLMFQSEDAGWNEETGEEYNQSFEVNSPRNEKISGEELLDRIMAAVPHKNTAESTYHYLVANDLIVCDKKEKKRGSEFAKKYLGDDYFHYEDDGE